MGGQLSAATAEHDIALDAWQRAGETAAARHAHEVALAFFRKALTELAAFPATLARDRREIPILFALGSSLVEVGGFGHPDLQEVMERARTLCERVGDRWHTGLALGCLANGCINRAELDRGIALAQDCLAIA